MERAASRKRFTRALRFESTSTDLNIIDGKKKPGPCSKDATLKQAELFHAGFVRDTRFSEKGIPVLGLRCGNGKKRHWRFEA